jgi:hypothetical protein
LSRLFAGIYILFVPVFGFAYLHFSSPENQLHEKELANRSLGMGY